MKRIDGIWWPDEDVECHRVVPGQVKDLEKALKYVKKHDLCVQAGGNVGIWPLYLANIFDEVLTFEPDADNFECLKQNIQFVGNISAHHQAIGKEEGWCGLDKDPRNAGAHQIIEGGFIPISSIDSFELEACDFIVLDIEGSEPQALEGAKETIKQFKPVIMIEDKGLSERYGVPKGWSESFPGYTVAEKVHRDVILIPE